ncbi:MAG: SDR family oxidoreductase [Deltaproteobacteria bacterium]|nr:SDR family oxidoreductase [Deltaproteobacteria bacterium]
MAIFTDKAIVVTGASEGIGRALCLALAPQKAKLAIAARNEGRLHELKSELEKKGAQALVIKADVTSEEDCKRLIGMTIDKWGSIDVLVNNAGGTMWTNFEDITDTSLFEKMIRLNYLGSVYCTYYALPHLKKSRGLIVAVSSVAGMTGVPTRTAYAASKHALFGFFDSLRIELEGTGVSITMVAPDFVLSEIHRRALGHDGKPLGKSPLQESKIMTAEKCAAQIVKAMENRDRLLITSPRAKVGRWIRLFSPRLIDHIAKKAIREKK